MTLSLAERARRLLAASRRKLPKLQGLQIERDEAAEEVSTLKTVRLGADLTTRQLINRHLLPEAVQRLRAADAALLEAKGSPK